MPEILKQWGAAIITAVAVILLITIVQSDTMESTVSGAFTNLINSFSSKAGLITP